MRLGLTPIELARRVRSTQSRIMAIEDGDPALDLLQLVAIAAALEISLRQLLRRAERRIGWVNPAGHGGVTAKRQKRKQ
jgi:hypothetical protein